MRSEYNRKPPLWVRLGVCGSKLTRHFGRKKSAILIVKFGSLGDALLYTGALKALRKQYPSYDLVMAASSRAAPILERYNEIDELILLDEEATGKSDMLARLNRVIFVARILSRIYKLAVFPWYVIQSAVNNLSNRRKVGISSQSEMALIFARLDSEKTICLSDPASVSVADECLITEPGGELLLASIGEHEQELDKIRKILHTAGCSDVQKLQDIRPRLKISAEELVWARSKTSRLRTGERCDIVISLCVGARFKYKAWTGRKYGAFIRLLAVKYSGRRLGVFLLGAMEDNDVALEILKNNNPDQAIVENLCGKTSIWQAAAIIKESDLCVGNDTFGLHAAIAVDTPSVVIMWGGDGDRWIPWGDRRRHRMVRVQVQCGGCGGVCRHANFECMDHIKPEDVFAEVVALLEEVKFS